MWQPKQHKYHLSLLLLLLLQLLPQGLVFKAELHSWGCGPLRTLLPIPKTPGLGWGPRAWPGLRMHCSAPLAGAQPLTWQPQPQQDTVIHDGDDADHAG